MSNTAKLTVIATAEVLYDGFTVKEGDRGSVLHRAGNDVLVDFGNATATTMVLGDDCDLLS